MYVAPPMRMGVWSMARVLRQRVECYYYVYDYRSEVHSESIGQVNDTSDICEYYDFRCDGILHLFWNGVIS